MKRLPIGWGTAWLLAMVLARALVPTGFMPAWEDGRLTLVLCEGQGALPAAGHAAHHHHEGASPASSHHAAGDCSFAQSAHPALLSFNLVHQEPAAIALAAGMAGRSRAPISDIPRYRAARGPPLPS